MQNPGLSSPGFSQHSPAHCLSLCTDQDPENSTEEVAERMWHAMLACWTPCRNKRGWLGTLLSTVPPYSIHSLRHFFIQGGHPTWPSKQASVITCSGGCWAKWDVHPRTKRPLPCEPSLHPEDVDSGDHPLPTHPCNVRPSPHPHAPVTQGYLWN